MNKKFWIISAALVAAGAYTFTRSNTPTVPADLRDAPNSVYGQEQPDAGSAGWEIVPQVPAQEAAAQGSEKETFESCLAQAGAARDGDIVRYENLLSARKLTGAEFKERVADATEIHTISVLTCKDLFDKN
ncbi:MAG TPA: hypothetical protein DCS63_11130 [Elusimicrobia bacterium]|nr:hypothetical protein [Elusimicrobiota bacterium]